MTPAEYKERREILLKQLSDLDAEFNGTSSSTSKNKNIVDTIIQCISTHLNPYVVWDTKKFNLVTKRFYYDGEAPRPFLQYTSKYMGGETPYIYSAYKERKMWNLGDTSNRGYKDYYNAMSFGNGSTTYPSFMPVFLFSIKWFYDWGNVYGNI